MEEKLKKRTGCTCDLCRSESPKPRPKARPWWETEYDAVRKRQDKEEQEDFDAERDYLKRWNPGDYWC